MTVALWWETTSIVINTALALVVLAVAIALVWRSGRAAREANIVLPGFTAALLAGAVITFPSTHSVGELQDGLNQQLSSSTSFAPQVWADVWSNIHTITVCTVLLHNIYIALLAALAVAVLVAASTAVRWFAEHPAAQHFDSVAERLRHTFLIHRPAAAQPAAAGPVSAQPRPTWTIFKKPATAVALGAAVVIIATIALAAMLTTPPESTVAQRPYAEPPELPTGNSVSSGSIPAASQPASKLPAEPDMLIPFVLSPEPCSIEVNCAIRTANGRVTLTLAHPTTLTAVSLVPDQLVPGRIVTHARWDFDDAAQTSETVHYDPVKDPGWSVVHPLSHHIRTSKLALTVLATVPADPKTSPPGPGIAAVLSAHARPPSPCDPDYTGVRPADLTCPTARSPR